MMSDAFYSANNSILKRSLTRIGLPSALEPVSMINDGRRQDAWLWAPCCSGLSLVLDATVVSTFAQGQYKDYTRGLVSQPQKLRPQNAKIPWPPNKLPLSTSGNGDHWCVWEVHCPFFEWSYKETCWCVWRPRERQWLHQRMSLAAASGNAASILACVQVWSNLPVLFLAAVNVLTTITAYHLPLYQCVATAFRILVVSVRFIVPSVVQCYLVHWLNILSIAWPMIRYSVVSCSTLPETSEAFFLKRKKVGY